MAEQEKPSVLEEAITRTTQSFRSKKTFIYERRRFGWDIYSAAIEVIDQLVNEQGISVGSLAVKFAESTSLPPTKVNMLGDLYQAESWEEYFAEMSRYILAEEVTTRFPDIKEANAKRAWWSQPIK